METKVLWEIPEETLRDESEWFCVKRQPESGLPELPVFADINVTDMTASGLGLNDPDDQYISITVHLYTEEELDATAGGFDDYAVLHIKAPVGAPLVEDMDREFALLLLDKMKKRFGTHLFDEFKENF